jgi:putative flippase GtrA
MPGVQREFGRFCVVGASGYAVNLAVYATVVDEIGFAAAAAVSFAVAASNNYVWNRLWTFGARRERVASQGTRAVGVSMLSLGANQICLLALVAAGVEHLAAQAVAILLVTPFSFVANKLWAFAEGGRLAELSTQAAES